MQIILENQGKIQVVDNMLHYHNKTRIAQNDTIGSILQTITCRDVTLITFWGISEVALQKYIVLTFCPVKRQIFKVGGVTHLPYLGCLNVKIVDD